MKAPGAPRLAWGAGPHLPAFVKGGAMGVAGKRVVYAGGMAYPWRETEAVWCLEPTSGVWEPGPALPVGRAYTEGATVRDGLLVVGGRRSGPDGRRSLEDAWWLRPDGGNALEWHRLPNLTSGRAVASLATDGRHVLAIGGGVWERSQGGAFATLEVSRCERLDLEDLDAGWREAGPVPGDPRASAACASVCGASGEGAAYLLGGYTCWTEGGARRVRRLADAWRYDFGGGAWTRLADLPGATSGACAAAVGPGRIALVGGVFHWRRDGAQVAHTVAHMRDAGTPRARYVGGYSDLVWLYDTEADAWTLEEERLPIGVNDHRCALHEGRLWVAGGETVDAALSNTTELVSVADIEVA